MCAKGCGNTEEGEREAFWLEMEDGGTWTVEWEVGGIELGFLKEARVSSQLQLHLNGAHFLTQQYRD